MTALTYTRGVWLQLNVANAMTLSRVALVFPLILFAFNEWSWLAVAVVIAAGLTDYFDGELARGRGECTPLGRVIDPLADKVFIDLALLIAVFTLGLKWLLILLLATAAYDIWNTIQRWQEIRRALLNLRNDTADLPVSMLSKTKTALLFVLVAYCFAPPWLQSEWLITLSAQICLAFVLASGLYNCYSRIAK